MTIKRKSEELGRKLEGKVYGDLEKKKEAKGSVRTLLPEGAAYTLTQVRKIQPPRAPPLVLFDKCAFDRDGIPESGYARVVR